MKLSRIRGAFPWRIVAVLALVLCLPLLSFWAWFGWELQPLQRYYLIDYWGSTEGAKQLGSQTQIQWLVASAPGRKNQIVLEAEVTANGGSGLPFQPSPYALEQGWAGVQKAAVQSYRSVELEELLREYFYDGQSLRQLVAEPFLYLCAAWLILLLPVYGMRVQLAAEWRRLLPPLSEPEWVWDTRRDWPPDQQGIEARIRSRIARWISMPKARLSWARFRAASHRPFTVNPSPKTVRNRDAHARVPTGVQRERSTALPVADPHPSEPPKAIPEGRVLFPGCSTDETRDAQPRPWDESKWID